jgi:hypothetical protein
MAFIFSYGGLPPKSEGEDSPLTEDFRRHAVGTAAEDERQNAPPGIDLDHVTLPLMGAQDVDLGLEAGQVGREYFLGETESPPRRVVLVESRLDIAGDGEKALAPAGHADRIQFKEGQAVIVIELPELRQVLHQRTDVVRWAAEVPQCVVDVERLGTGDRVEGDDFLALRRDLLHVDPSIGRQGHDRVAIKGRGADVDVNLDIRGDKPLEGDPVCLHQAAPLLVDCEIELLLRDHRLVGIVDDPHQSGFSLFSDAAKKDRLDDASPCVPLDEPADLVKGCAGAQGFRYGKVDQPEQLVSEFHSGDLHNRPLP